MVHPCLNYLVGLVGLSLMLVSCEKSDVNGVSPEHDAERSIVFGSWLSKAPVNDVSSMTDFKVWGWAHKGQSYTNLFNGTKVFLPSGTYEGGLQYWMDGCMHDFYGVYPYPPTYHSVSVDQNGTLTAQLDAMAIGEQAVDLMTAVNKVPTYVYNKDVQPEPVKMTFSHELAKVEFFVKAMQQVKVLARLYGISQGGTLTKQYPEASPVWTSSWALGADCNYENTPFKIDTPLEVPEVVATKYGLYLFGGLMLLPPQELKKTTASQQGATLHLTYTYEDGTTKTKVVDLTKVKQVGSWEASKAYRYEIIIPKHTFNVEITVSVTDWNNKDISTTL